LAGYNTAKYTKMAKNRKITKHITLAQMDFLKYMEEHEIDVFTIEEIQHGGFGKDITVEPLGNLTRKGFLHRLERGKYCRSTFKNENVIGTFLVPDGAVAYWNALRLHGLTAQFPNSIFIQTTKRKNAVSLFGSDFQFIKIRPEKRTGIIYNGYGNHKFPLTDVEKTIVDCFDLPQYSGGYAALIYAFCQANLNAEKLINYCAAINNLAATKRMGFLVELFEKRELADFIAFAKTKINRTYNLFDPFGSNSGETNSDWCLRINLSTENILGIMQNQY
jgi:predicted transcriptional regulator of viral defense system